MSDTAATTLPDQGPDQSPGHRSSNGRARGLLYMSGLAVLVGIIAGIGAWAFRLLIGFIHNVSFLGVFSPDYNANLHTPESPWGIGVVLVPVIGGMGVVWLVKTFAPEAKGHGVPEVMDAIHYKEGRIRPMVAVVKSLASALSIGTGGSVGREGPIIQIGASFGSTLGQLLDLPARQKVVLIAAGAGAGIAATFNAPIGGMIFAIELLLVAINASTMLPVAIATVIATWLGRVLIGPDPAFDIPDLTIAPMHVREVTELILFAPLGVIMGLVSFAFIRGLYWSEDKFEAMPGNDYTRHAIGMFAMGLIMLLFQRFAGHYYVDGVGYAAIQDILYAALTDPWFLFLLFLAKFSATCLTLGSGASGGVFSPSLFMGATVGAAYGQVIHKVAPGLSTDPVTFAVTGMAAAIGGTTGAVLTAVMMICEMTRDYQALLPLVITVAIAHGVRKAISRESIYTLKLLRRGHVVPEGLQAAVDGARMVRDVMQSRLHLVSADAPLTACDHASLVLDGDDRLMGVLPPIPCLGHADETAGKRANRHFIVVEPTAQLVDTLRAMHEAEAVFAIVSDDPGSPTRGSIRGLLSEREIANAAKSIARVM